MKFNTEFKIRFEINTIKSDDFAKIKILESDEEYDSPDCFANGMFINAYEGDIFVANAIYAKSEKYGFLVKLKSIPQLDIPKEKKALCKYAASQIVGVSAKTVERVYDVFGNDFVSIINEHPEEIQKIQIPKSKQEAIVDWCFNHIGYSTISTELRMMGFSPYESISIYKALGNRSLVEIKTDPYKIFFYELSTFDKCDNVFLKILKKDKTDIIRLKAMLYNYLIFLQDNGDMAVPYQEICERLYAFQSKNKVEFTPELIDECIKSLGGRIVKKTFKDETFLALVDNYIAEAKIAKYVREANLCPTIADSSYIEKLCDPGLMVKQREAVVKSLTNKISILTGGPGTGKTFTIKNMISVAKQLNPDITIALMAPTGKAASRMIEVIGQEATTIHARLGLSELDDLSSEDGMVIDEDLVVIDEVSMMEEKLFAYFVRHVSPDTRIVLVGDSGQLPSVGAGNLLEELIAFVPTTELNVTKRTGVGVLNKNAQRIRKGEIDKIDFNNPDNFDFRETLNVVDLAVDNYMWLTEGDHSPLILASQHTPYGVDEINKRIQDLNDNEERIFDNKKFKINDRVMCTKNCKKLMIHNGDQGRVVAFTKEGLEIIFDGKDETTEINDLSIICLSYCITVHKSQGSEADTVIMVCPEQHEKMLNKKLIYTAITRAKDRFIGIGSKDAFLKGCGKDGKRRVSLLGCLYNV